VNKLCLTAAVIVAVAVCCASENVEQTEKFATQFKSAVNANELQAWATNLVAKTTAEKNTSGTYPAPVGSGVKSRFAAF